MILRVYRMTVADGREAEVRDVLKRLVDVVRDLPGCAGAEAMGDIDDPRSVLFIERWADRAAHEAASAQMPRDALKALVACLDTPPAAGWFQAING
ncbi:putative quinol monooxygenase [Sphingobium sp. EM0848]|uniref:putative quinol monooxygenase n=1 Tax=Sphingobium sp. EM0848 TaxID=2743473 RepID=UPI00159C82DD|nr:antibiotic biosynthesis monooxygenase [Sphingobium sp. EM0848]